MAVEGHSIYRIAKKRYCLLTIIMHTNIMNTANKKE